MFSSATFTERRARLVESMPHEFCVVVPAASSIPSSADAVHGLVPSRNLYYLTGIVQEGTWLFMWRLAGRPEVKECLFITPYDEEYAKWYGTVLTKEQATDISGISEVRFSGVQDKFLEKLVCKEGLRNFHFDWHRTGMGDFSGRGLSLVRRFRDAFPDVAVHSAGESIFRLRMIKDEKEVQCIRAATELTRRGFEQAVTRLKPGMREYEFEAELLYRWAFEGEKTPAFPTICAGGPRATCLHYGENRAVLSDGELLLIDHGAMKDLYCADITRTVPVNGKYSPRQRELMDLVLEVQNKAIQLLRPGILHRQWGEEVNIFYRELMLSRGVINRPEDFEKYFYHGIGHHIGLDTHDDQVPQIPISPGMVFTVEPGFYSAEEGIGIRIEDDVLVGEAGNTVLSEGFPRTPDEIEELMRK